MDVSFRVATGYTVVLLCLLSLNSLLVCTSMCNQEDKENSGYENFDNANIAASPLILFHCSGNEGRLQKPCEFPESANILSSTSVYINKEFWNPTTSMYSQKDKENSGYQNFDHANVPASPLMLFHCSGKESRLQELYKFPESAPTSCLRLLST
jgi:hypothetical protein